MPTSVLSRSVITVASLAIGSMALAGTAGAAATPSGVTREQVLTAVNGVREAQATDSSTDYSDATMRALKAIVAQGCDVSIADEDGFDRTPDVLTMTAGDDADGLLIATDVEDDRGNKRYCLLTAVAATDAQFQLSGTLALIGVRPVESDEGGHREETLTVQTSALSGDTFVTAPLYPAELDLRLTSFAMTAAGNASRTTTVTTTSRVADKVTKSQKKTAKKAYTKRLRAAKKSYAKALDKAGSSKSKKAKAKKAWSKKKASAKTKYRAATRIFKNVQVTNNTVENRPFSIRASADQPS